MTYDLYIGDRTFSSWSMRGWLLLRAFGIPYNPHMIGLYGGTMAADLAPLAPARLVPVLKTPEGYVLQDTLAMAETLHERHPEAGLYPADPERRAFARWLVAEMHSGFTALRGACPMNLAHSWADFEVSEAVKAELERIETLWAKARELAPGGPWLLGDYSAADAFYAPVAARIAGYGLPVSEAAQAYVDMHLNDPVFRQWRAMGLTKVYDPMPYREATIEAIWPGPARLEAKPVDAGPSENELCPYSDKPVTHFMELDGRVFGFCNAFCRDKTVNDPAAWEKFMAIYQS